MINSKDLSELTPEIKAKAEQLIKKCAEAGIKISVTSTYRDFEAQEKLYNQVPKVTQAKPGNSFHNYRLAFDVVPIVNNKAIWNDENLWSKIGAIGESIGLTWGGKFSSFPDKPHFQKSGISIADLKKKIIEIAKQTVSTVKTIATNATTNINDNKSKYTVFAMITLAAILFYKKR